MLNKICEECKVNFTLPNLHKKNLKRRFCGPICSRRWASKNRSDSWREKCSIAKQGANNPMFGVKHTDEAKKKISEIQMGRPSGMLGKTHSMESNLKRSESLIGIKRSAETISKIIQTKIDKGIFWRPDDPQYTEFKKYKRKVYYWTNKNNLTILDNYFKRGKFQYHLDHKYSITKGFENNIPPKIIGNIHNLEFLPFKENVSKGINCSITIEELYELQQSRT